MNAQQAQQQQREHPMVTELKGVVVFQAAKLQQSEQALIQHQQVLAQTQAVLEQSEAIAKDRQATIERLVKDLEAIRVMCDCPSVEELVKEAHAEYNARLKAEPAPSPLVELVEPASA